MLSTTRTHLFALVLTTASLALAGCADPSATHTEPASAQSQAPTSIDPSEHTLGLTYIPNVQFAPVYVAQDNGMFMASGKSTEIRHHGTEEGLFTALLAGQESVVLASGDEALMARSQGMNLVSVGTYYQQNPLTILVPENSAIRTLVDLRGKKIGIPGEYGSSWIGLQAILAAAQMTPKDVQVASIGYTQLAAMAAGEVDAIVAFSNNEAVWFPSAGVAVRSLEMPQLPLVSASLITTQENLETSAEAVCATVLATQAGMKRTVDSPQLAIEATQKRDTSLTAPDAVAGARDVLRATSSLFVTDDGQVSARPDLRQWSVMLDFYAATFGKDFADINLESIVSERCFEQ